MATNMGIKIKLHSKFLLSGLILLFVIYWIVSSSHYLLSEDYGILTLDGRFSANKLYSRRWGEQFKGDTTSGEFTTPYPNFGMLKIRFDTHQRINNDTLIFRIKEKGANDWYYSNKYNTDQFQTGKLFPFGFPLITNSAGKTYDFEIESLNGSIGNAISIDGTYPTIISRHVFTKSELIRNKSLLSYFIQTKIINIISDNSFRTVSFIYLIPLVFTFLYLRFSRSPSVLSIIALLLIFFDIFLVLEYHDALLITVLLIWLFIIIRYRIDSKVPIIFSLVSIILSLFFYLTSAQRYSEKLAVWAFQLQVISLISELIQKIIKRPPTESATEYFTNIKISIKEKFSLVIWMYRNFSHTAEYTLQMSSSILRNKVVNLTSLLTTSTKDVVKITSSQIIDKNQEILVSSSKKIIFVAFLIAGMIKLSYIAAIYILPVYLVFKVISSIRGFYLFYYNFYITNQIQLFWQSFAKYLVVYYPAVLILYLVIYRNIRITKFKAIAASIVIFTTFLPVQALFNNNTTYRNDIVIWKLSGNNFSEPWVDVYIIGRNFKDAPFVGKVLIDGVQQRIISWSDQEISFRTDPSVTKSGKISVETYDSKISNSFDFQYTGNR